MDKLLKYYRHIRQFPEGGSVYDINGPEEDWRGLWRSIQIEANGSPVKPTGYWFEEGLIALDSVKKT